jgi:hypothetical protein
MPREANNRRDHLEWPFEFIWSSKGALAACPLTDAATRL